MSSALTDADQDAGLREEPPLHSFCINPVVGQNIRAEGTYRFTTEAEAFAYAEWARSTIATLRARATAAADKLRDREAEIERLMEALGRIIAEAPESDPGEARDEWGGHRSYGDYDDVANDASNETAWRLAQIARAALASTEPHASSEEASDAQ